MAAEARRTYRASAVRSSVLSSHPPFPSEVPAMSIEVRPHHLLGATSTHNTNLDHLANDALDRSFSRRSWWSMRHEAKCAIRSTDAC